jgi:hypothetical protein
MYDPSDTLLTILFWFLVAGIPLGLARWAFGRWFAKHGDQEEARRVRERFRFLK